MAQRSRRRHHRDMVWSCSRSRKTVCISPNPTIEAGAESTSAYLVGTVPGPASNLRTKSLTDGSFAVIVIGKASEDGSYHNPTKPAKPRSSARVYDKLPIRIWDTYVTAERNSIWYTRLERRTAQSNRWSLSETGFVNALQGTNLEHPDPNPLLGADFDVSATGILFTAVDPLTIRFLSSKHDSYYVSLETFQEHPASRPQKISVSGYSGSSSCPTFSPDGKSAAFLKAQDPVDEYDRSRIFILHSIDNVEDLSEIVTTTDKETWDLQPTGLKFSCDAKDLYITADFCGNSRLYSVPTATHPKKPITAIPKPLTTVGSVSSLYTVSPTKLLVSTSSYVDSSTFAILDPKTSESRQISSLTSNGSAFGLRPSQVSGITFRGAGDYDVQAFIVTPSSCDPHKKYPMLLWVHGGPVSVWTNAWSTRWNPVVFAEQGYVVVACNPTGSLGFGEDYVQGVKGEWGGRPYVDLVGCFEYVKENVKFVDTEKAVAMGGSYGGYMMNWYPKSQSYYGRIPTYDHVSGSRANPSQSPSVPSSTTTASSQCPIC